ncbi:uncharacterized protein A1O9_08696 [Exophiala aquamarina CBS 119918]|uniref:Uncharacterized protein n=1 Tax=Exophiala aquamarina CBS 119918 TaxID=1182545 RepID=A0A072P6X8_9EURO|nr:uncharacterized protein A1O9_08696 [Exophiala aquamarina CBS 119918]KEF55043.1 hypothetical protein A1O9_08696 [Exophiala aquamarina CBS 119918]
MEVGHRPCAPTLEGIPSELRLRILQDVLVSDDPISITFDPHGYIRLIRGQHVEPVESLGLLTTSIQMYDAAATIFYGENKFVLPWTAALAFLGVYQFTSAQQLRCLEIRSSLKSPFFGFAPFINALADGAPDQLREIIITFQDPAKALACVFELTNAVAACTSFESPTLEFVFAPMKDSSTFPSATSASFVSLASRICSTLAEPNGNFHDFHQFSGPYCKQDLLSTNASPNLQKITIVGPIPPALLPELEAHTCKVGQCGIEKLSSYRDPKHYDKMTTSDRHHYIWKKKDHPDVFPGVDMRQFHPLLPEKYREQLGEEFDVWPLRNGGFAERIDDDLPFPYDVFENEDEEVEAPPAPDPIPRFALVGEYLSSVNVQRRGFLASRREDRARRLNDLIAGSTKTINPFLVGDNAMARGSMHDSGDAETTTSDTTMAPHVQAQTHQAMTDAMTSHQADATPSQIPTGGRSSNSGPSALPLSGTAEDAGSIMSNGNSANNIPHHGRSGLDVIDWVNNSD